MEIHQESLETYKFISDWIDPKFPYSRKDVWHRMGMVGVFADFVCSCTAGAILEIGVGESSIYLTQVSKKYDRKIIHCDVAPGKILNPLTVPGYLSEDNAVITKESMNGKDSRCTIFIGDSDDLFKYVKIPDLALSFIDGDHNYSQVKKDFYNAFNCTVENGYILLHDTYPPDETYLGDSRCGTVYQLRQELAGFPWLDMITLPRGTAMGVGLTIIRKKPAHVPEYQR